MQIHNSVLQFYMSKLLSKGSMSSGVMTRPMKRIDPRRKDNKFTLHVFFFDFDVIQWPWQIPVFLFLMMKKKG